MKKYYMVQCAGCGKMRRSTGVQKIEMKDGDRWVWRGYCKACRDKHGINRVPEKKRDA